MGSVGIPKPWVPYMNTKDCSQGFCSIYCPQWCYIIFPPPPPIEFSDDSSGPSFSPLVIAIIGILASAFLLVSYYAIISKYCGNMDSAARRENHDPNEELEESDDPSNHEPWQIASTGLDEALIKSITVCKYKKEDGLVEGTDCSVCLSEFEEYESLRLLPKCSHAFHVTCIDTWLKSHSSCPLCRANIIFINASPLPLPPVIEEAPPNNESLPDGHFDNDSNENSDVAEDAEVVVGEEEIFRALSNSGNLEGRDTIIEIRDEDNQRIRRSVSMDYSFQTTRVSIADVLRLNQDRDFQIEECEFQGGVGSSKQAAVEMRKSRDRNRVLHKRSFSSGRFSFCRRGREQNPMIPL